MQVERLAIPEVVLFTPEQHADARGSLMEAFNQARYEAALGRPLQFVQDNHSCSRQGVLRGLHYQLGRPQAKLVRVLVGAVFDVAVDLRRGSPSFGRWVAATLSATNRCQMWVPEGFAHGFYTLSEQAEVLYKLTDYWSPEHERVLAWDDPRVAIDWPLNGAPILGPRDQQAATLANADCFA